MGEPAAGAVPDVLHTSEAGGRVIRGGVVRASGFAFGVALGIATSMLLLRHLGVDEYGRYGTVVALVAIVLGFGDAGLTAVGARELSVLPIGHERERVLAALGSIRLVTTTLGVLGAIAFAAIAYDRTLVLGTVLVGIAGILISLQSMATLALNVALRIVPITVLEVLRYALTLVGVAVLVATGAALVPFFALPIVVGAVVLVATVAFVRRSFRLRLGFDRALIRQLVRVTLPLSLAVAMNVLYVGAMVVIVSLLTDEHETGLYVASARIMEVLVLLPAIVLNLALPILSVAGRANLDRLGYVLQRMTEVGLLLAALIVVAVALVADRVVVLLGGAEFAEAGDILRVQVVALLGVFLSQTLQLTLIALRAQRALVLGNALALALVLGLGIGFVSAWGAEGGAIAVVAAEACLAVLLLVLLARTERRVFPDFHFVWKVAACSGAACLVLVAPDFSPWLQALAASAIFVAVAFLVRAVPREVLVALASALSSRPRAAAALTRLAGR